MENNNYISDLTSGFTGALLSAAANFLDSHKLKKIRKKQLRKLLRDSRFPDGRKLETLSLKTGTTIEECRDLLVEIGAKGIKLKDNTEGWTLNE